MGRGHNHSRFSPVEHIPYGEELTEGIEQFAFQKHLNCHSYYHDLPVWIVYEQRATDGRLRRLQITVYLVSNVPYVSLVPSVDVFVTPEKVRVPKHASAIRFELKKVITKKTLNRVTLLGHLEDAWRKSATVKYKPEEMMEIDISEQLSASSTRKSVATLSGSIVR